jgi:hypothetical protein
MRINPNFQALSEYQIHRSFDFAVACAPTAAQDDKC